MAIEIRQGYAENEISFQDAQNTILDYMQRTGGDRVVAANDAWLGPVEQGVATGISAAAAFQFIRQVAPRMASTVAAFIRARRGAPVMIPGVGRSQEDISGLDDAQLAIYREATQQQIDPRLARELAASNELVGLSDADRSTVYQAVLQAQMADVTGTMTVAEIRRMDKVVGRHLPAAQVGVATVPGPPAGALAEASAGAEDQDGRSKEGFYFEIHQTFNADVSEERVTQIKLATITAIREAIAPLIQ